jgi:hypothetical protein
VVADIGQLDLVDLGPEFGHQRRRERRGDEGADVQHPQPFERSGGHVARLRCILHFDLHALPCRVCRAAQ